MTLEFRTVAGELIGYVTVLGETVEASSSMQTLVDSWILRGLPIQGFIDAHIGSNGYWVGTVRPPNTL